MGRDAVRVFGRPAPGVCAILHITKGEYLALPLVERQEALLQAVVLNERPRGLQVEDGLEDLVFESQSVPFTVEATGCEWDGRQARVTQPGAQLTLTFSCAPQTEAYLCIRGMDYRDIQGLRLYLRGPVGRDGASRPRRPSCA